MYIAYPFAQLCANSRKMTLANLRMIFPATDCVIIKVKINLKGYGYFNHKL